MGPMTPMRMTPSSAAAAEEAAALPADDAAELDAAPPVCWALDEQPARTAAPTATEPATAPALRKLRREMRFFMMCLLGFASCSIIFFLLQKEEKARSA